MNTPRTKLHIALKILAFLIGFILLHYAYDWTGLAFWRIFSGVSEGIFQHAKIGFYAYLGISLLEYAVLRKRIPSRSRFFFSRLGVAVFLPWLMVLIWYQAPAILGQPMPQEWLEVIYAILTTSLLGWVCAMLEADLEKLEFSKTTKVILIVIAVASIELFTIFTFTTPWAGFFTHP